MNRFLVCVALVLVVGLVPAQDWVPGNYTKSGRYVQGHWRKERKRSSSKRTAPATTNTSVSIDDKGVGTTSTTRRERIGDTNFSTTTRVGRNGVSTTRRSSRRLGPGRTASTSVTTKSSVFKVKKAPRKRG